MFDEIKPKYDLIYKVKDGVGLPMKIFLPENYSGDKLPCVLCIHGGGWRGAIKDNSAWDGSWMTNHAKYYAKNGKIGVSISYRDLDLSEQTDTCDQIEDCIDAVKYIKENVKEADFDRLCFIGDSAGAHLALAAAFMADADLRPYKIAACNPVTDLTAQTWKDTAKTEEKRRLISPLYIIDTMELKGRMPEILCMHGDKDTVVPIADTIAFSKKLNEHGIKSEMITIEGAQHAFILWGYTAREEDVNKCMKKIDEFFFE